MAGKRDDRDSTTCKPQVDRVVIRFIALLAGVYALIVVAGLVGFLVDVMSWSAWFVSPQGDNRIHYTISAGNQVAGWFADHAGYTPYLVHATIAMCFSFVTLRFAAGSRVQLVSWILLGGRR